MSSFPGRGVARAFIASLLVAAAALPLAAAPAKKIADIAPASPIQSGMVLQREMPVPVWGKAQPGETVSVSFAGQKKTTVTGADGGWSLKLDPLAANAAGADLTIAYEVPAKKKGYPAPLVLSDVLVGEVWLLSGQSNMEFGVANMEGSATELSDAEYPEIRLFMVNKDSYGLPLSSLDAEWVPCDGESVRAGGWGGFSAIGFLFGRRLHKELGVPVGLVQAAFGGAPIATFLPYDDVMSCKPLKAERRDLKKATEAYQKALQTNPAVLHPWIRHSDYAKLKPTTAFNAMINPLAPFAFRGALWYQGESNVGQGDSYAAAMRALVTSWRRVFGNPALSVYWAQIAPWKYGGSLPSMWDFQTRALSGESGAIDPLTGMALTIDVGDPADIHPRKKVPVADRFARLALAKTYGKAIKAEGPVFDSMKVAGNTVTVKLANADGLRTTDGKAPISFALSSDRINWVPATALIKGESVELTATGVSDPVAVKYAWEDCPTVNVVDGEGLPLRPFKQEDPTTRPLD